MWDQRIGRPRCAVSKREDRCRRAFSRFGDDAAHALLDALRDAARRIIGRRRNLPGLDPPRLLVEQADVGEGAARIYANAPTRHAARPAMTVAPARMLEGWLLSLKAHGNAACTSTH